MRIDEAAGRWPAMPNPFEDDDPSTVRVITGLDYAVPVDRGRTQPEPEPEPSPPARLGKPWEREARDDLEKALAAARNMSEDVEAFIGWLGRFNLGLAADYDHLIGDCDAIIDRLERYAGQL